MSVAATRAVVAPPARPDAVAVLASIGWEAVAVPEDIKGGWDTLLWKFATADGKSHALRLYRSSGERDIRAAAREEASLIHVHSAGLPVPTIEAKGAYLGQPLFIQSWEPGQPLVDMIAKRPWLVGKVARQFGQLQAWMHAINPAWDVTGAVRASRIRDEALRLRIERELQGDAFCHYDFHPLNVLGERAHLTALLDFPNSGRGDRRLDLGLTKALLLAAPPPPGPIRPLVQLLRKRFAANWEKGYREEAGAWPLTPLFEAAGAATYMADFEEAVAEERGWANAADLAVMRRYLDGRLREVGLASLK